MPQSDRKIDRAKVKWNRIGYHAKFAVMEGGVRRSQVSGGTILARQTDRHQAVFVCLQRTRGVGRTWGLFLLEKSNYFHGYARAGRQWAKSVVSACARSSDVLERTWRGEGSGQGVGLELG
jgi:hypothetical protein